MLKSNIVQMMIHDVFINCQNFRLKKSNHYPLLMEATEREDRVVWNEVNTDFDPDEETVNFGTRHALETEGNLYEVSLINNVPYD